MNVHQGEVDLSRPEPAVPKKVLIIILPYLGKYLQVFIGTEKSLLIKRDKLSFNKNLDP